MPVRVSQKIQKSEFWNATYPSGFHRLDEPPEKISRPNMHPNMHIWPYLAYLGAYLGARNMVKWGVPEMLKFFLVAHLAYENHWGK